MASLKHLLKIVDTERMCDGLAGYKMGMMQAGSCRSSTWRVVELEGLVSAHSLFTQIETGWRIGWNITLEWEQMKLSCMLQRYLQFCSLEVVRGCRK